MHTPSPTVDELVSRFLSDEDITMIDSIVPPDDHPDSVWTAILYLTQRDLSAEQVSWLAAGPIESLLAWHGGRFIGRVEAEAKRSPAFASILRGVWRHDMPQEIWQRIESARAGGVE
jgi:hypothetical protein